MRHQGGRCFKEAGDKRGHGSSVLAATSSACSRHRLRVPASLRSLSLATHPSHIPKFFAHLPPISTQLLHQPRLIVTGTPQVSSPVFGALSVGQTPQPHPLTGARFPAQRHICERHAVSEADSKRSPPGHTEAASTLSASASVCRGTCTGFPGQVTDPSRDHLNFRNMHASAESVLARPSSDLVPISMLGQ